MAKPAGNAAPTTAAGIARPFRAAGLVVPGRFTVVPLLPSQVRPMYEGDETPEQKAAREAEEKREKELGGRLKKQEEKLVKQFQAELKTAIEASNTAILEQIKTLLPNTEKKDPPAGGGGGGDKDKDLENHPVIAGLRKQLDDEKKERVKAKEALDAEKAKTRAESRNRELRETLQKHLAESGIPEDEVRRLTRATNELIRDGLVKFESEEDGAGIVFIEKDEAIDLPTGIAGWLKTDVGKSWLPPRGAAGSGDGPFGRNPGSQQAGKPSSAQLVGHLLGVRQ